MNKKISLIIHGGCSFFDKTIPIEAKRYQEQSAELKKCITAGWKILSEGGNALDVVERTICLMEDSAVFETGLGAALDIDKKVALDASIMRGDTLQAGAVAKLRSIPNAISVARKVMEHTRHVLLVDQGANKFADLHGFEKFADEQFITEYQLYLWNKQAEIEANLGTVGCVAMDSNGLIAAGTSTGGMIRNLYGRVGDSPIIGAGTYADNTLGGASSTGYGEQIIRVNLAKHALDLIHYKQLSPTQACREAIKKLGTLKDGIGGIILIGPDGTIGYATNTKMLPSAYMHSGIEKPVVNMEYDEI